MSNHKNRWRAKLLVDLSTGQINEQNHDFTSDRFISNSFDPTSCDNDSVILLNQDDLNRSNSLMNCRIETSSISQDVRYLDSSFNTSNERLISENAFELDTLYDVTDIASSYDNASTVEICNENLVTGSSYYINEPLQINNSESVLDEITGVFVASIVPSTNEECLLDEVTGELRSVEPSSPNNNETDSEIFNKRKNKKFNREQRLKGKEYVGRKRATNTSLEYVHKEKKQKKEKPCTHGTEIKTARSLICGEITEEQRDSIFKYFWSLDSWEGKKAYLKNLIRLRPIIRRRKGDINKTAKQNGFDYNLPNENNEMIKVCKKFFLSTFDLNNDTLTEWTKKINENLIPQKETNMTVMRTNNLPPVVPKTPKKSVVLQWLDLLPKVPSHYCRSSTSRVYVENTFRSKSHMHRVFKKWCFDNGYSPCHRKLFCLVLKEQKISIYKPRKDQCDTCTAHKEGNLTEEEYKLHFDMKNEEAYEAKREALSKCSSDVLVLTMDVQGVLLCPKLNVSAQYYKQKLQLHNFTIYCNNDKEVHLFVWHEGDGGVNASEFVSCIVKFLKLKIPDGYKKVILISDGCTYQNRNKILSSALLSLSKETNIEIEQLILEKGHTMMEVDSVHSTLENLFKPPIYSANDYINIMRHARPAIPYVVHHLDYTAFNNYEKVSQFTSIRPGKKAGDPVVTDIRGLLYKDGILSYKLRHPEEWKVIPQRLRLNDEPLVHLYDSPLKIDRTKFDCLQSLKQYMHRDHHYFYDGLQHS